MDFDTWWNSLSQGNKGLFHGVAMGWWEGVDTKRWQPIPFPKIINIHGWDEKKTMAHVFAEAGVFDSVSEARKAGWNKPLATGEFWFKQRTIRVLVIWCEEAK